MYDVAVIGGGPVGSYVAYKLAEMGHGVVVLEQKPRLRVLDADLQAFLASRSVGREEKPAPRRRKRATDVKEFF